MPENVHFEGVYSHPSFGQVGVKIRVIDGHAVWTFSDVRLAKALYAQKKAFKENVQLKERLASFIQTYPNKTRLEVIDIIKKEHQEAGDAFKLKEKEKR